jgi:hypothetical protein
MVVKMSITVFWIMTPCGLICGYQHFGGTYHLHLHSEYKFTPVLRLQMMKACNRSGGRAAHILNLMLVALAFVTLPPG